MQLMVGCSGRSEPELLGRHGRDRPGSSTEDRLTGESEFSGAVGRVRERAIRHGFVVGDIKRDDRLSLPRFGVVATKVDAAIRFKLEKAGASGTVAIWSISRDPTVLPHVVIQTAELLDERDDFSRFHLTGWLLVILEADDGWTSMEETQELLQRLVAE